MVFVSHISLNISRYLAKSNSPAETILGKELTFLNNCYMTGQKVYITSITQPFTNHASKSNMKSIRSLLIPDFHLFSATAASVFVSVCERLFCQIVLPPCWQAIAMQAHIQTHPNMPSSWPQGRCSCLAHNSD